MFFNIQTATPAKNRKGLEAFITEDGYKAFKLYDTIILGINTKHILLNTNGFFTRHTKNCMNDNLPEGYKVFQKNYSWFVTTPTGFVPFKDEMVLTR